MREAITNLSKQQNLQLQRLLHHYGLDSKTSSKTQKYYRQLRKIHYQFDQQTYSIDDMMKASIVIAQKSQIIFTIKGEKIKGFSLSLNEMVKSSISLVKLINIIKLFITNSKFLQEQLRQDLNQLVQQATFGLNYVQKFQRAIQYFDFIQLVDKSYGYIDTFKSFTWIFFLQSRQKLQITSQFQSDYLLISIMYLMVRYAFNYLRPNNIPQFNQGRTAQKHFITSVLQKLFQIFLIDDVVNFKRITSKVDDYFEKLISLRLIKCNHYDHYDFLSPELININYRKIDSLYQKQRDPNSIDYRLFLNNRLPTLTPRRFSQISQKQDQGCNNKKSFKQKSFASHKILTFQPEENHVDREQGVKFHPIKLPNNIKVSPSNIKIPLIHANRRSPYSPIQNYILRQIKSTRVTDKSFDDEQQIISCLKAVLSQYCSCSQLLEDKVIITYQYYLVLVQKFFLVEKQIDQDDYNGLYSSLLIYALQIVICSLSQRQQQIDDLKRTHLKIKDFIVTDSYYLWIVNKYFTKQAAKLPAFLRTMPLIMKQLIFTEFIWQQDDVVYQLIAKFREPINNGKSIHERNMNQLLQAIFKQIKINITNMLSQFDEIDSIQQVSAKIQQTMKYIIVECSEIIKSRSILHILVCSIYLVLRSNGFNIKFNDIVIVFQEINHLNAAYFKKLLHLIEIKDNENMQYCNIIQFYNQSFLPYIKGHLQNIKKWGHSLENGNERDSRGSIKLNQDKQQRYKSIPSQQSQQKNHNLIEQSRSERSQKKQTEGSPRISLPLNRKKEQVTDSITRKETTIRSRPITAMINCLNTEKIKSPSIIR